MVPRLHEAGPRGIDVLRGSGEVGRDQRGGRGMEEQMAVAVLIRPDVEVQMRFESPRCARQLKSGIYAHKADTGSGWDGRPPRGSRGGLTRHGPGSITKRARRGATIRRHLPTFTEPIMTYQRRSSSA